MTQVSFRIDEDVKLNAEAALKEMGLSMSTAINMFLVKVGREKRIPFEINIDPFYSEANMRYLNKEISDIESGKTKLVEHDRKKYERNVSKFKKDNELRKKNAEDTGNNIRTKQQEDDYDDMMQLLADIGVPFSPTGEPLGIGDD